MLDTCGMFKRLLSFTLRSLKLAYDLGLVELHELDAEINKNASHLPIGIQDWWWIAN